MHPNVFETSLVTASTWLKELLTSLQLPSSDTPRALRALRAGLHAIRDRLPATEVVELGAQLPTLIRGIYYEGFTLRNDPARIRDRAALLTRVRREVGNDPKLDAYQVLRGVIALLVDHVSPGEIEDVAATLPRSIAELWQDLIAESIDTVAGQQPQPPHVSRRTGYSR